MTVSQLRKGAKIYATLLTEVGKVYDVARAQEPVIVKRQLGGYIECHLKNNPYFTTQIKDTAEVVKHRDGWKLKSDEPLSGGEQTSLI